MKYIYVYMQKRIISKMWLIYQHMIIYTAAVSLIFIFGGGWKGQDSTVQKYNPLFALKHFYPEQLIMQCDFRANMA
jgi:hypothetical protein